MKISKILLVDDDRLCRRIAEIYLRQAGKFEVIVADSGEQALEQAEKEQPDLILLDTRMPGMDGFTTLVKLRDKASTCSIPVIFLTAGDVDREASRTSGVLGTIIKGNMSGLVDAISSLTKNL